VLIQNHSTGKTMKPTILHYLYDPLCGWCYGAAPLIRATRGIIPVRLHGGGLMTGDARQTITPQLRAWVNRHDQQIAQASGQLFGKGYMDGLLHETGVILDSAPPIAAVLAADQLAGRGLDMLARLQLAHYTEGRHLAERPVLIGLAAALGLDAAAFASALDQHSGEPVQAHIRETRELMAQTGAQGFPTLLLETAQEMQPLPIMEFLGQPQAFQQYLGRRTSDRNRDQGRI
jgi:putative protein-disulfide isomerase